MIASFISIPKGVAKILGLNNKIQINCHNDVEHRPDKVLRDKSFRKELINNTMSNTSPISFENGTKYEIYSDLFISYFGR